MGLNFAKQQADVNRYRCCVRFSKREMYLHLFQQKRGSIYICFSQMKGSVASLTGVKAGAEGHLIPTGKQEVQDAGVPVAQKVLAKLLVFLVKLQQTHMTGIQMAWYDTLGRRPAFFTECPTRTCEASPTKRGKPARVWRAGLTHFMHP